MKDYETKQSGEKAQYKSGMQRDNSTGKPRPDLITDEMMRSLYGVEATKGSVVWFFRDWRSYFSNKKDDVRTYEPPINGRLSYLLEQVMKLGRLTPDEMALRLGGVLERGGRYYGYWNWQKANSQEELDRFYESAERHLVQWLANDPSDPEDHLAGALFNIMCAEWLRNKLKGKK